MAVFLFDELIFGPVHSRRLGISLGVNLLPLHAKLCSFNCVYCECGWTKENNAGKESLPEREQIRTLMQQKLISLRGTPLEPNSITFAGNGEPTLHPQFVEIISDVIQLRNEWAPLAKVSVLSNGSMLHKPEIVEALMQVDNNILKLDGGTEAVIESINMPKKAIALNTYIGQLMSFNGKLTIQSLFVRGTLNGKSIDNTTSTEIDAWLGKIKQINPQLVMVYAIERDTATAGLEKVSGNELEVIAEKVRALGVNAEVFY